MFIINLLESQLHCVPARCPWQALSLATARLFICEGVRIAPVS